MHHLSLCKSSQQHENEMFTQPEVRSQCPYIDHLPSMLYLNNNQNPTMSGHSVFPSVQGEPLSDLLADAHISRHPYINSYTHQSQGLDVGASTDEQVEYENGTLVPATVLQTLLASRACVYENVDDPSLCHVSNSRAFVYDQMQSSISDVWLQPQPMVSDNESLSYLYNAAMFNNELLSLSLTTLQSNGVTQDHRAEMSCSDVTMNQDLGRCSEPVSESNYLMAMQEILADMSRFSFENVDMGRYDSNSMPSNSGECSESGGRVSLQRHEIDTKKKQLKILLKMADDGYNNCLKEVHNVISKFHPITGLNPEEHTNFVLLTTSFLYRSLKERISAQIHEMKAHLRSDSTTEQECSFDSTFIHKQWAIQQMRRKEHQLWRPQRGLPERSVSVLRAWMFQNFLRPYPKDSEKHMLAIKSGLTRSQVSNWFINARVRLWKPMIEEMYAEINRRKSHWKGHATDDSTRGDSSMGIQRFERD